MRGFVQNSVYLSDYFHFDFSRNQKEFILYPDLNFDTYITNRVGLGLLGLHSFFFFNTRIIE